MSEQQPQQEPWTRPPAQGAPGEQGTPAAQGTPNVKGTPAAQGTPNVPGAPGVQPGAVPGAVPAAGSAWVPPSPYLGPAYQAPPQQVGTVAVDPRRRTRRILVGGGAAAVIAAALAVAVAVQGGPATETSAVNPATGQSSDGSSSQGSAGSSSAAPGSSGSSGSSGSDGSSSAGQGGFVPHGGRGGRAGGQPGSGFAFGAPGTQAGSASGSSQLSGATAATATQEKGVVTIDATLKYEGATSAGTGMILSSDGLVLTNNHVVDGATAIQVTDESTGKQYTAVVVGTDASSDVALLQLQDASGLTPVTVDGDGGVTDGAGITAVGNAEGTGDLVAADGTVTDTNQTMTAQTETGAPSETLNGLIEFQAAVVSGDSGGPVLDSDGEVVGMTTAASNGPGTTIAYAITIENALAVVHQIESGSTADGVTLGYPAFLGVAFSSGSSGNGFPGLDGTGLGTTTNGATIAGVIDGTPASSLGLAAGDTITKVDGTAVSSSDDLSATLAKHKPGDRVSLTWVSGTTGTSSSGTVTLIAGPAN